MTKVTFETAAFGDSIKKANAIAPTRGKEFDQYKGFHLEVRNESNTVCLRSTNGEVYYTEMMTPLKMEGDNIDWRIPSSVTNGIVSALPIGSGKTVTFENESGFMRITSGRMRARVPLISNDYYPDWEGFDSDALQVVEGFGARLDQVGWASDRGNLPPLNGVYIDNNSMVATNKVRVASVPIAFDIGVGLGHVVVPISILASVVRGMEEIKVGVVGNFLCIAPNEDTQIKCILFQEDYPKVSKVFELVHTSLVMLNRDIVMDTLNRVLAVGTSDRQLPLKIVLGNEEISFHVRDENKTEEIEESIYLPGQANHEPIEYLFAPENFSDAISKSPNKEMIFNYNTNEQSKGVKFEGGSGYVVFVRPRVRTKEGAGSAE